MDELTGRNVMWRKPPYGYQLDPQSMGHLIPDREAIKIVKRIFRDAGQGVSFTAIAQALNHSEIPSPRRYRAYNKPKQNDAKDVFAEDVWRATTVRRIALNPVYTGRSCIVPKVFSDIEDISNYPVTHEPIVTDEEYRAALSLYRQRHPEGELKPMLTPLFKGFVFCATCGCLLDLSVDTGEPLLTCQKEKRRMGESCTAPGSIRLSDLQALVVNELNDLVPQWYTAQDKCEADLKIKDEHERHERLNQILTRIDLIDRIVMRVYEDMDSGLLLPRSGKSMISKYQSEIAHLSEEEKKLGILHTQPAVTHEPFESKGTIPGIPLSVEALTKELVKSFIERIEVGPRLPSADPPEETDGEHAYAQSIHVFYKYGG